VSSEVSRELGARCDAKEECAERCLPPGAEFPGGLCTRSCLADADCPAGAACADEEGGVCLFVCVVDGDCAFLGGGWRCDGKDALPMGEARVCIGD
jgi:hypothetical protein